MLRGFFHAPKQKVYVLAMLYHVDLSYTTHTVPAVSTYYVHGKEKMTLPPQKATINLCKLLHNVVEQDTDESC